MKYLKLFEDVDNDLWKEIPFSEYEEYEVIELSEKTKEDIISIFKLPLNKGWSNIKYFSNADKDYWSMGKDKSSSLIITIESVFPTTFQRGTDYDWIFTFELCDDYWYIVIADDGYNETYYKCDDIIGIKKLLQHLEILK